MSRAFDPLEEIANVVEVQTGPEFAEVSGLHGEAAAHRRRARRRKTAAKRLIHGLAERTVRLPRFRPQLRRHIVVEGEGRAHIMMLMTRHHDVNAR